MADNITKMVESFNAMEDTIQGMKRSIANAKAFVQDMEPQVNRIALDVDSTRAGSTDLIATLIKERDADRAEFEAVIKKTKDEAKEEIEAAIAQAKKDAIAELDAETIKNREEVQKQLVSLQQLGNMFSQKSKASEEMSVTTFTSQPVSEAESSTSFEAICDELLQHTDNYLRTLNLEYRVDINAVSK